MFINNKRSNVLNLLNMGGYSCENLSEIFGYEENEKICNI